MLLGSRSAACCDDRICSCTIFVNKRKKTKKHTHIFFESTTAEVDASCISKRVPISLTSSLERNRKRHFLSMTNDLRSSRVRNSFEITSHDTTQTQSRGLVRRSSLAYCRIYFAYGAICSALMRVITLPIFVIPAICIISVGNSSHRYTEETQRQHHTPPMLWL